MARCVLLLRRSWRSHRLGYGVSLSGGADAKKLDMRAIIRTAAITVVVVTVGWSGCQSTHSDTSSRTTAPGPNPSAAIVERPSEPVPAPVPPSPEQDPSTIPATVQHSQRGMENMPAPSTARPATQPPKTLALSGPPRVPSRLTNQPVPASLVVTQAPPGPEKGRAVIGPLSFQGPPRHRAYTTTSQQKLWTGILGGLVLAGVGLLVLMRKMPLWREKLRCMVPRKGGKSQDGPKLVLQGAPQKASPLGEE